MAHSQLSVVYMEGRILIPLLLLIASTVLTVLLCITLSRLQSCRTADIEEAKE